MAIKHADYKVRGVQFHPESIMTEHGIQMIGHFLRCGLTPQTVAKLASGEIGLFLHLNCGAAEV